MADLPRRLREPDADYIVDFAKRKETEYGEQMTEDEKAYSYYRRKQRVEAANPGKGKEKQEVPIRATRTSRAGMMMDRNASILAEPPTPHVNSPKNDVKARQHASSLLEPFLAGDWVRSQIGPTWFNQQRDVVIYGRGWSEKMPSPRLWADPMFLELVEAQQEADDPKPTQKKIDRYYRENYPIRWTWYDARNVWPEWSNEYYLPEVVRIVRMSPSQIATEYGEEFAPPGKQTSTADVEVYVYYNWMYCATVISESGSQGGKMARMWRHGLGMQPMILEEAFVLADKGVRWKSMLYDYYDTIDAENEALTDARTISRRYSIAAPTFTLDPEARGLGNPQGATTFPKEEFKYDGTPNFLWRGETETLGASPQLNDTVWRQLSFLADYNNTVLFNRNLMGEPLSGQSASTVAIATRNAKIPLSPYRAAATRAAEQSFALAFRSVLRLNEEYPDAIDKVTVVHTKMGEISVGPDDVDGWEHLVQARPPIDDEDRTTAATIAQVKQGLPYSPLTIMEEELGTENAEEEADKWVMWQVLLSLVQQGVLGQSVMTKAGMVSQQGVDLQGVAQRIAQLPLEEQMALQAVLGPMMQGQQGPQANTQAEAMRNGQGVANMRREEVTPPQRVT